MGKSSARSRRFTHRLVVSSWHQGCLEKKPGSRKQGLGQLVVADWYGRNICNITDSYGQELKQVACYGA